MTKSESVFFLGLLGGLGANRSYGRDFRKSVKEKEIGCGAVVQVELHEER